MKAAVYRYSDIGKERVQIVEVKAPKLSKYCRRHQVLCKVVCAGLNPVDAKCLYGEKAPASCMPLIQSVARRHGVGLDFSGVVLEAREGSGYKARDEVFGTAPPLTGTLAEYVLTDASCVSPKPVGMSFAEAACLPLVGLTALRALEERSLCAGQHLLVIGAAGGAGHIAVQIGKSMGARVTAVCSRGSADFVSELGADSVVPYDDPAENLLEALLAACARHGPADLVFDAVTSNEPRERAWGYELLVQSHRLLRPNGAYIALGGNSQDWMRAHLRRCPIVNLCSPRRELFWVRLTNCSEELQRLATLWESGDLHVHITKRCSLTTGDVQGAFNDLLGRHCRGKIVVQVCADTSEEARAACEVLDTGRTHVDAGEDEEQRAKSVEERKQE